VKLHSDYTPEINKPFIKKNQKKKGRIRFKCLHCEYLTFRKQNLIEHLREKHEVPLNIIMLKLTHVLFILTIFVID